MINAYDEAVKLLPAKTAAALGKELRCAEEFRLRTGYAMTALIDGRELPVSDTSVTQEDIACGIIYTVLQTIGGAAVLSALNSPIKDFVLIGNLTQLPQCREVFSKMEAIYHVHFHIPPYAEYRTAIGAALAYVKERQG